ncbi:unnamed protein product [Ceratitis capitata]|uniref:(Mediterranean fruit fly) hypothetical protein n=1 Tax=Ceratitis capitata TaxID=7213 RepID=A0A811U353_CERCA|nr:unnamed protein product [Ceratitis capitata]
MKTMSNSSPLSTASLYKNRVKSCVDLTVMENINLHFGRFLLLYTILTSPTAAVSHRAAEGKAQPIAADAATARASSDAVKVVSGTKVKRFERMTVPLGSQFIQHPIYLGYNYVSASKCDNLKGNKQK